MKKKLILSLVMVLVLSLTLPMATVSAANGVTYDLYRKVGKAPADMHGSWGWLEPVGSVGAEVVGDNLVITYTAYSGWEITETHLWVGEDINDYPQTPNGNPRLGHFPWRGEYDPALPQVTYVISLDTFPSYPPLDVVVLAQAVVRPSGGGGPEETAWGDCNPLPGPPPRWAKCFYYSYTPPAGG